MLTIIAKRRPKLDRHLREYDEELLFDAVQAVAEDSAESAPANQPGNLYT